MNQSPKPVNFAGIDALRLTAVVMVTIQHALTLSDLDSWTTLGRLNVGQSAVAIFMAISGLLAGISKASPTEWLLKRLRRIYVPYWIVTAAAFLLAWFVRHKDFDAAQVACQMAGVGLFTHGSQLVNSVTWFVSILIPCYLAAYAAHLSGFPAIVAWVLVSFATASIVTGTNVWPMFHIAAFTAAFAIAASMSSKYVPRACVIVAAICTCLSSAWPAFLYVAIAVSSVGVSLLVPRVPSIVKVGAKYSYEYYLVHGIALYGALRVARLDPVLGVAVGVAIAAAAAVLLSALVTRSTNVVRPAASVVGSTRAV